MVRIPPRGGAEEALRRDCSDCSGGLFPGCGDLDFEASGLLPLEYNALEKFLFETEGWSSVLERFGVARLFALSFAARTALALLGGFDDNGIGSTGACCASGGWAIGGL